jgi:hypothetical protein
VTVTNTLHLNAVKPSTSDPTYTEWTKNFQQACKRMAENVMTYLKLKEAEYNISTGNNNYKATINSIENRMAEILKIQAKKSVVPCRMIGRDDK